MKDETYTKQRGNFCFIFIITLQAVSNPKLVGTSLHFKSPSMVLGHPITRVFIFLLLNEKIKKDKFTKRLLTQLYGETKDFIQKLYSNILKSKEPCYFNPGLLAKG